MNTVFCRLLGSLLILLSLSDAANAQDAKLDILENLSERLVQFFNHSNGNLQVSEEQNVRLYEELMVNTGFEGRLSELRESDKNVLEALAGIREVIQNPIQGTIWFHSASEQPFTDGTPEEGTVLFSSKAPEKNLHLPRHWFAIRYFTVEGEKKIRSIRLYLDARTAFQMTAASQGLALRNGFQVRGASFSIPYTLDSGFEYIHVEYSVDHDGVGNYIVSDSLTDRRAISFLEAMNSVIAKLHRISRLNPDQTKGIRNLLNRLSLHDLAGLEPYSPIAEHFFVQVFLKRLKEFKEIYKKALKNNQNSEMTNLSLERLLAEIFYTLDPTCIFCNNILDPQEGSTIPSTRLFNLTDQVHPMEILGWKRSLLQFLSSLIPVDELRNAKIISMESGGNPSVNLVALGEYIRKSKKMIAQMDERELCILAITDLIKKIDKILEFSILAALDNSAMGKPTELNLGWMPVEGEFALRRWSMRTPREKILGAQARRAFRGSGIPTTIYPPRR